MKAIQVLKLAGGAILVAASLQANAQTTDQSTAATAAAAPAKRAGRRPKNRKSRPNNKRNAGPRGRSQF